MTVKEAAQILNRDVQTVRIMIEQNKIPGAISYRKLNAKRNVYHINQKPFLQWVYGKEIK